MKLFGKLLWRNKGDSDDTTKSDQPVENFITAIHEPSQERKADAMIKRLWKIAVPTRNVEEDTKDKVWDALNIEDKKFDLDSQLSIPDYLRLKTPFSTKFGGAPAVSLRELSQLGISERREVINRLIGATLKIIIAGDIVSISADEIVIIGEREVSFKQFLIQPDTLMRKEWGEK